MINHQRVIERAQKLLIQNGVTQQLSAQAKCVVTAMCEEMEAALMLSNKAVALQINAVKETPTGRMKRPTLEEIKAHGLKIGLPSIECEKFFNFYESKGWKVGGQPMKLWTAAMANWKRRCEQPQQNGAVTVIQGQEYTRVIDRMRTLRSTYGDAQTWCAEDKAEFIKLRDRRNQLRIILGITV